jgi:tetratricopeptide (TPR) repeat protein
MKRRTHLLGFLWLLLAPCAFAQSAALDRAEILSRLAQGYWPSYVAHLVKTRGVKFSISADFIERVKLAGGDGVLVERLFASDASEQSHPIHDADASFDHLARCAELIHEGGIEEAEGECRASIADNPSSGWPLLATAKVLELESSARGSAESAKKKQEERRELLRRAAALTPNIASLHRDLAQGLPRTDAMAEFQTASSLDPEKLELTEAGEMTQQISLSFFSPGNDGLELAGSSHEPINIDPELQRRIKLEPDLASNHLYLAIRNLQVRNVDEAGSELQEALRLEPDNPVLHTTLAGYYFHQRNQEACLAELRECVRIVPQGVTQRTMLAGALELFGRSADAIKEVQNVLASKPAQVEPSDLLVEIYLQHKDRKSAIAELRRSLKASSLTFTNEAEFMLVRYQDEERLANLLKENQDFAAAGEQFAYMLRFQPEALALHIEYGNVLMEEKDFDGAIAEFRRSLEINPDNAQVQILLGTALGRGGDLSGAKEQFDEVAANNPEDLGTREQLGYAYMQLKDENEAINQLKSALELAPNSAQAENNLAWLYATADDRKLRNPAEALVLARRAVKDSPQPNAAYLDTLAEALLLNGQAGEAVTIEQQAFELDPQNPELVLRLTHFRDAAQQAASRKP